MFQLAKRIRKYNGMQIVITQNIKDFVGSDELMRKSAAFLLPYYFRATGRAGFTMAVALTAMAVFRLALAWLFVKVLHRNVLWIWYAMFADWVFRIAAYGPAFRRDEKRTRAGLDKPQQLG